MLHELVHERTHGVVEAEAEEANEVDAVGAADGADLCHELLVLGPLVEAAVEDLDSHGEAVGEDALVHLAEATGAEAGRVVVGESGEL